jgi:hypothetical protein
MKTILKIGYHAYLMPDTASAAKVLELLAKSVRVEDRLFREEIQLSGEKDVPLELKVVPLGTRFVTEEGEPFTPDASPRKKPLRINGRVLALENRLAL